MAELSDAFNKLSLCYYQTMRGRARSLIDSYYTQPVNQTGSPAV